MTFTLRYIYLWENNHSVIIIIISVGGGLDFHKLFICRKKIWQLKNITTIYQNIFIDGFQISELIYNPYAENISVFNDKKKEK